VTHHEGQFVPPRYSYWLSGTTGFDARHVLLEPLQQRDKIPGGKNVIFHELPEIGDRSDMRVDGMGPAAPHAGCQDGHCRIPTYLNAPDSGDSGCSPMGLATGPQIRIGKCERNGRFAIAPNLMRR
jgi:hypothetical protein